MDLLDPKASQNGTYVSTGALPPVEQVRALVAEAHQRFATIGQGQVSQVYPALARVDPALFGICVVDATGGIVSVGAAGHEFTIMSVSKPFVFALVCDLIDSPAVFRMRDLQASASWRNRLRAEVVEGNAAGGATGG